MNKWVVVVIMILVASVFLAFKTSLIPARMPRWLRLPGRQVVPVSDVYRPEERIDQNTGELQTRTTGQWEKLGQKNGKYMNPESGEYTMVVPIKCAVCGEKIPDVDIPAELAGPFPDEESRQKAAAEITQFKSKYHCPQCAGLVYSEPKQPRQPPPQPPEQKEATLNKPIIMFAIPALALVGAVVCVYAWACRKRKIRTDDSSQHTEQTD